MPSLIERGDVPIKPLHSILQLNYWGEGRPFPVGPSHHPSEGVLPPRSLQACCPLCHPQESLTFLNPSTGGREQPQPALPALACSLLSVAAVTVGPTCYVVHLSLVLFLPLCRTQAPRGQGLLSVLFSMCFPDFLTKCLQYGK